MKLKNLTYRGLVFEADKGTGGNPPASSAETEKPEKSTEEKTIPYSRFTEVNNELKKLRDELKAKTDAEEAAKQQQLKDQAQWKTLAEQQEAKAKELEPQVEILRKESEKLQETLKAQVKAQMENVPELVRPLLEKMDLVDQLQWIVDNRDKLKDSTTQQKKGVPPVPKPDGKLGAEEKKELQRKQSWSKF